MCIYKQIVKENLRMERKIERIKSTMAGKPADRVPVILDFEISYACEYAGIDFLEVTWNYDKII